MWRNENPKRPTTGCLSVPLFNQRKRSRLPQTSNPSESQMCSNSEFSDMVSIPASYTSDSEGNEQASTHWVPLTQRNQWSLKNSPKSQAQQANTWASALPGFAERRCISIPQPQKKPWSQTGSQKPQGKQNSMATTQGFRPSGFPGGSGATQFQNKPYTARKPIQQQNSKNTPLTPSHPNACNQKPEAQSQSSQWKFKSVGVTGGATWVEDTFGITKSNSAPQQQKSTVAQENPIATPSLRILTAVIEGMKHWSQFKDKIPMMFEIFGTLDSAVTIGKYGAKNFLLRDGKDTVPCVFYETDRMLPRLIRGQVHRCVGNYDRQKNVLTCFSVRAASPSEKRNAQEVVKVSDAEMRAAVQTLSEI